VYLSTNCLQINCWALNIKAKLVQCTDAKTACDINSICVLVAAILAATAPAPTYDAQKDRYVQKLQVHDKSCGSTLLCVAYSSTLYCRHRSSINDAFMQHSVPEDCMQLACDHYSNTRIHHNAQVAAMCSCRAVLYMLHVVQHCSVLIDK
jgi:hypothetical protein